MYYTNKDKSFTRLTIIKYENSCNHTMKQCNNKIMNILERLKIKGKKKTGMNNLINWMFISKTFFFANVLGVKNHLDSSPQNLAWLT